MLDCIINRLVLGGGTRTACSRRRSHDRPAIRISSHECSIVRRSFIRTYERVLTAPLIQQTERTDITLSIVSSTEVAGHHSNGPLRYIVIRRIATNRSRLMRMGSSYCHRIISRRPNMPTPKYIHMVSGSRRTINCDDSIALGNGTRLLTCGGEVNPTVLQLNVLDNLAFTVSLPQHLDRLRIQSRRSDGGSILTTDATCRSSSTVTHDRSLELVCATSLRHHIRIGGFLALIERIPAQIDGDDHARIVLAVTDDSSRHRILAITRNVEIVLVVRTGENPERDVGSLRTVVILTLDLDISTMCRSLVFTLASGSGTRRAVQTLTPQVFGHIPCIGIIERSGIFNRIVDELSLSSVGNTRSIVFRSLVSSALRHRTQLNRLQRKLMGGYFGSELTSKRNLGYHTLHLERRSGMLFVISRGVLGLPRPLSAHRQTILNVEAGTDTEAIGFQRRKQILIFLGAVELVLAHVGDGVDRTIVGSLQSNGQRSFGIGQSYIFNNFLEHQLTVAVVELENPKILDGFLSIRSRSVAGTRNRIIAGRKRHSFLAPHPNALRTRNERNNRAVHRRNRDTQRSRHQLAPGRRSARLDRLDVLAASRKQSPDKDKRHDFFQTFHNHLYLIIL